MKYKNQLFGLLGIAGIFSLILFLNISTIFGNTSYFAPTASLGTSTTTPVFMVSSLSGVSTSTVTYDTYALKGTNQNPGQKSDTTDSAVLLIQFTATSTSSVLNWRYEYSQDGQDWYADNQVLAQSTSTPTITTSTPNGYLWVFSSSTSLCDFATTTASNVRGCKAIVVATPTRFVRAVFSMTGANGSVYAQFVPKKQQQQ